MIVRAGTRVQRDTLDADRRPRQTASDSAEFRDRAGSFAASITVLRNSRADFAGNADCRALAGQAPNRFVALVRVDELSLRETV